MRGLALVAVVLCSAPLIRAETAQERLKEATTVLNEVMATPDKGIPQDLLEKAHCAVIVPGMKAGGFVIGAKYGRGFAVCRREGGGWGAPGAVRIEGGSFGLQIGATNSDIIMLVMSDRGMRSLIEDKFTLGADASVAAGPVGRSASAQTDAQLSAEILSWSRSKGLFAGIALAGSTMRNDLDENKALYGREVHNKDVLMTAMKPPASAQPLISALNRYSRFEAKDKPLESRGADAIKGEADRSKTQKK
jgi:SH3 domain-containing YSC84-like protein 1